LHGGSRHSPASSFQPPWFSSSGCRHARHVIPKAETAKPKQVRPYLLAPRFG
jgi:hypothetical protein